MKLKWKLFQLAASAFVAGLGIGCGGFSGSHSISPATFLLPGLGHHSPPQTAPEAAPETPATVAMNTASAR